MLAWRRVDEFTPHKYRNAKKTHLPIESPVLLEPAHRTRAPALQELTISILNESNHRERDLSDSVTDRGRCVATCYRSNSGYVANQYSCFRPNVCVGELVNRS